MKMNLALACSLCFLLVVAVFVNGTDGRKWMPKGYYDTLKLNEERGTMTGWECRGGDNCCTSDYPCGYSEGDCDRDNQCLGIMICGSNNCKDILDDGSGVGLRGTTADDWNWDDDCCTFEEDILAVMRRDYHFGPN